MDKTKLAEGVITALVMAIEDGEPPHIDRDDAIALIEGFEQLSKQRQPEAHHNGLMQLSHRLADTQLLLRHTQEKLGKALERNSAMAGELEAAQRERDEYHQRLANAEHQLEMSELAKFNLRAQRKAQFRKRRAVEAELKRRDAQEPVIYQIQNHHDGSWSKCCKQTFDQYRDFHREWNKGEHNAPVRALYAAAPAAVLPPEIVNVAKSLREWIDAIPSDVVASLPTMPGMDRDWVDSVIAGASNEAR